MKKPMWNSEAVKAYETGQGVELVATPHPHYQPLPKELKSQESVAVKESLQVEMIEVLKQMVEALEWCHGGEPIGTAEAIKVGKQAIKELESQEPVPTIEDLEQEIYQNTRNFVSLDVMEWMLKRYYTHPPQRTWQGLTKEQLATTDWSADFRAGALWAEAKLKEKNT